MNEGTISGIVHEVLPVKQITEKFSQQEIILHLEHEKYPQYISVITKEIPFAGKEGDEIIAKYWLRGRVWENKEGKKMYFNSIYVHSYQIISGKATFEAPATETKHQNLNTSFDDGEDELPF